MKKTMWIVVSAVALLLLVGMVAAQGQPVKGELTTEERAEHKVRLETTLTSKGLSNAITHLENNDKALQVLQRNMDRLTEKQAKMIQQMEEVHMRVEGENVKVKARMDGKFLGLFKVKKNVEYVVNAEGDVSRVPKWYDSLVPDEE